MQRTTPYLTTKILDRNVIEPKLTAITDMGIQISKRNK